MRASAVDCSVDEGVGAPTVCHLLALVLRNSALALLTSFRRWSEYALLPEGEERGAVRDRHTCQWGVFVRIPLSVGIPTRGVVISDGEAGMGAFFSLSFLGPLLQF